MKMDKRLSASNPCWLPTRGSATGLCWGSTVLLDPRYILGSSTVFVLKLARIVWYIA